ncbi:MAG: GNAT family N-acetyltransferase [Chloroflexi bacterium]|nr:GNAT family N-acetyltransferase [Chloroflexota bacterium]MDL1942557.1 GNAT family N-acetyltransferase [Chloroflexi bacterium CFX2]
MRKLLSYRREHKAFGQNTTFKGESMKIELRTPSRSDRILIRRMMELYAYDFSEFEDSDLDEHGQFGYGNLDYFWFEPTHAAFLVTVDEKLAGFVLVDNETYIEGNERSITEFFVMRKYRRRGVGKRVAVEVFNRLPAKWEVRVIENNTPAKAFWKKVIGGYTKGKYQETLLDTDDWKGPAFSFDNREMRA